MIVIYELTEMHVAELHKLFQHEWWTKGRSLEETQQCVSGSQICVGLVDQKDRLQGFSRVLTDYTIKACIFDVIVAKPHRGKGMGHTLLSLITTHSSLKRVKHFEMYGRPDVFGFYEKLGFVREVEGVHLMRYIKA